MGHNDPVSDLIDTTEMYLRTIYELVEEGIVPLRARIAERLHQSGPTVSQTVARMERDGLVTVEGDRHLELTAEGHAPRDPGDAQAPAGRAAAHRRDRARLGARACRGVPLGARDVRDRRAPPASTCSATPRSRRTATRSRGSASSGSPAPTSEFLHGTELLADLAGEDQASVRVRRISEELQKDEPLMGTLRRIGALPDKVVGVTATDAGVLVGSGGETAELDLEAAGHIFVSRV